jgi:hypothetical protein
VVRHSLIQLISYQTSDHVILCSFPLLLLLFLQFGEHPEERANNEEITEKLVGVTTVSEIYAAIKDKVGRITTM